MNMLRKLLKLKQRRKKKIPTHYVARNTWTPEHSSASKTLPTHFWNLAAGICSHSTRGALESLVLILVIRSSLESMFQVILKVLHEAAIRGSVQARQDILHWTYKTASLWTWIKAWKTAWESMQRPRMDPKLFLVPPHLYSVPNLSA